MKEMTVPLPNNSTSDNEEDIITSQTANNEEKEDDSTNVNNLGWADSIAKILQSKKRKGKKSLVLSKAKKLTDKKPIKTKPAGYQVETITGEIKQEIIQEDEEINKDTSSNKKKKELVNNVRIKPNILEKDRERTLMKIATKGVLQLFNAVSKQQKDIKNKLKEAGPLDSRREKVLRNIDKDTFMNKLTGEKITIDEDETVEPIVKKSKKHENDQTWSVLRDDFMMSAKLKDWDRQIKQDLEVE